MEPPQDPQTVAIVLPSWLGDTVMATPALCALRQRFDTAQIVHVGPPACLEALEGSDLADAQKVDLSRIPPRAINFFRQVVCFRRRRFDLAVLLPNSFRSALVCWLGGARRRIGYNRDGRGGMLTDKLSPPRDPSGRRETIAAIDYYNALAEALGAKVLSRRMSLTATSVDQASAVALLAQERIDPHRPVIMLNPGGAYGPSKRYPADRFATVADALVERYGAQIVINAAPNERDLAAHLAQAMKHPPAVNFAERANSIGLLKGLLRRCDLLITNDTGARHVAAALGTAVVTIFGSTDPALSRIDFDRERIVLTSAPCAPCQRKTCPLPAGKEHHRCMKEISPKKVLAAVEELLPRTVTAQEDRS